MTQLVIRERHLLFFYKLLFLLCDTSISGIKEDKKIPYYSEVEKWSNIHAYHIILGGSYGHVFKPVKIPEMFAMMDAL